MIKASDRFLIIRTNKYIGNSEREFMAFVFGIEEEDDDQWLERADFWAAFYDVESELVEEIPEFNGEESPFAWFIDDCFFGRSYSEYHCYEIMCHPENEKYECDSILVGLRKKIPEKLWKFMEQRLKAFPEYMASLTYPQEGIEILDVDYFGIEYKRKPYEKE